MTNEEKKEYAKLLYVKDNLSQKEIAERCAVTEQTVTAWKKAGSWDKLKTSLIATKSSELARLYAQLSEINSAIEKKPEGERYANSKEADILTKITAAIRSLETETAISQVIDVSISVLEFARKIDIDKAKELADIFDSYIKNKLK